MASGGSSLDKLLGFLKGFLNSMQSPLPGFDIQNVKVNEKGDVFSSLFSFESTPDITDVSGEKIDYTVLLRALNGKEVFQPLFDSMARLSDPEMPEKDKVALLTVLLGPEHIANFNTESDDADSEVSFQDLVEDATPTESGLLGFKFANGDMTKSFGKYAGKDWSWGKIANDYLVYGLECAVPDAQTGYIDNVKLDRCSDLISEYLTKADVIISTNEVKVDPMLLVKPILMNMQTVLIKYYSEVADKITKGSDKDAEEADKLTKEEQEQANKDAAKANQVDIYEPTDEGLEFTGKSIDKTTPEGIAQIKDLAGHGYVGEGGANLLDLVANKHINITLKKITGTTDIELTGIKANYNPSEALDDIDDIIYQDEFLANLPEELTSYSIDVDDDGYDIEQCDTCFEIDPCESLGQVFKSGITMYRNLYILHWLSHGNDMMKLHLLCEELYEELIKEIDTLGELMVEKCDTIPVPDWCCSYLETTRKYEFQEGINIIADHIRDYLNTLDYAYPNQTSDVQSTFDEWLRYWNKQMNYFIKNQGE